MPNGWPLGLGNLNMRLRVTESLHPAATEPHPLHTPSSSCSSFSSSNLDTEIDQSTASFFQDHSVSLGRLIGIRSRETGCTSQMQAGLNNARVYQREDRAWMSPGNMEKKCVREFVFRYWLPSW
ncbi:hypothetical protein TEA_005530 [Camellia sinensis var. sinensis]|uniref:Uncharacterized protein n=1 Tax=Camellia sinensis var. sinensis TaxID=542762 RepID=A0A4S4EYN2_CAMSN|nr:hypothetical protein TEA_005530 [Camellia sinensis var. sinensis]